MYWIIKSHNKIFYYKVKIISNKTLTEGDALSINLTDLNNTGIPNEVVNITITNSKGEVVFDNIVKTNSEGNANVDLELTKGKYNVSVVFGGNENYTGNSTTQNLTIKEKDIEATASQSNNQKSSLYDKITVEKDPVSGGSITDLSQLSQDEYAQYLGYSDAEEMERETERKRAESYAKYN